MKKLAIAVTGALALGGIGAAVSSAINPTLGITATVSPNSHGTKKKPKKTKLVVKLSTTPDVNEAPSPATKAVVHLGNELTFNGKALKTCSAAKITADDTSCPKGSKVGSGFAHGNVRGVGGEDLTVKAFNGPGGNKLELLLDGSSPLTIHEVIEGVLSSDVAPYGKKLTVNIPADLQEPVPGAKVELLEFDTTINAVTGTKKRPYVGINSCRDKAISFGIDYTFQDGSTKSAQTTTTCK